MKQFISYDQYIALAIDERNKIREVFNVVKSGGMDVVDNEIVSDGTTPNDLARINIGAMLEYLGEVDRDYCNNLWLQVIDKVFGSSEKKEEKKEAPAEKKEEKKEAPAEKEKLLP